MNTLGGVRSRGHILLWKTSRASRSRRQGAARHAITRDVVILDLGCLFRVGTGVHLPRRPLPPISSSARCPGFLKEREWCPPRVFGISWFWPFMLAMSGEEALPGQPRNRASQAQDLKRAAISLRSTPDLHGGPLLASCDSYYERTHLYQTT